MLLMIIIGFYECKVGCSLQTLTVSPHFLLMLLFPLSSFFSFLFVCFKFCWELSVLVSTLAFSFIATVTFPFATFPTSCATLSAGLPPFTFIKLTKRKGTTLLLLGSPKIIFSADPKCCNGSSDEDYQGRLFFQSSSMVHHWRSVQCFSILMRPVC